MRTCARCQASTPSGLRFCNYCGARLGEASPADLVFGSLALDLRAEETAEAAPHFQPPRNLRALPSQDPGTMSRAKDLARSLAESLPGRAVGLASAATRLAARTASRVATAVAGALPDAETRAQAAVQTSHQPLTFSEPQVPSPTPLQVVPQPGTTAHAAPPAVTPSEMARLHPELQAAYKLYLQGRQAYARGDRKLAARLFVGALRQSPPDSPLGQFLRRVLRPRNGAPVDGGPEGLSEVPVQAPPVAQPQTPPQPQAPTVAGQHPRELALRRSALPEAEGLRVLSGGLDVSRAKARAVGSNSVGVAAPRGEGQDIEQRRRRARKQAQELWFRNLPTASPNRPSFLLDEADGGRDLEKVAGVTLMLSAFGFFLLLFL